MKRRRRESVDELGLSFLDCICCGFGAIILLLVLTKIGEPRVLEQAVEDLDGQVARLEEELHEIRGETRVLNRELTSRREQLSEEEVQVARLRGDLSRIQCEFDGSEDSIFQPFDAAGEQHMEYVRDRGEHADVPLASIQETFAGVYAHLDMGGTQGAPAEGSQNADFEAELEEEARSRASSGS